MGEESFCVFNHSMKKAFLRFQPCFVKGFFAFSAIAIWKLSWWAKSFFQSFRDRVFGVADFGGRNSFRKSYF